MFEHPEIHLLLLLSETMHGKYLKRQRLSYIKSIKNINDFHRETQISDLDMLNLVTDRDAALTR